MQIWSLFRNPIVTCKMPFITVELLRKRVEHNEGEIGSVEELALHQEKIEKIENLDKWCRNLKILLLQNNLIPKIENVGKLKQLDYLNLALNNIELIENLEGCESLTKLDLTLNFIGEITSVKNLQQNYFLESLYLTGNPCSDYPGYRKYVIQYLPQLKSLDGEDITPSERLVARQDLPEIEDDILACQGAYLIERQEQIARYKQEFEGQNLDVVNTEPDSDHWNRMTSNTPEIRRELSLHALKAEEKSRSAKSSCEPKPQSSKQMSLFFPDGRPKNINQAKIAFHLEDDEKLNRFVLDLAVPRFMDTSLLQIDLEPTYIKVVIKGKIFQLVMPEEIKPDASEAKRSQTTGHLLLVMPKETTLVSK